MVHGGFHPYITFCQAFTKYSKSGWLYPTMEAIHETCFAECDGISEDSNLSLCNIVTRLVTYLQDYFEIVQNCPVDIINFELAQITVDH